MKNLKLRISIIGMPGSGKTTLSRMLSDMLNLMYISVNELATINNVTHPLAVHQLVMDTIGDSESYILDGYPGSLEQAKKDLPHIDGVIFLTAPAWMCAERLKTAGFTMDYICDRMETYVETIQQLQGHYIKRGILKRIHSEANKTEVFGKAIVQLSKLGLTELERRINEYLRQPRGNKRPGNSA